MGRDRGETEATETAESRHNARLVTIKEETEEDHKMVSGFPERRSGHYSTGAGKVEEINK